VPGPPNISIDEGIIGRPAVRLAVRASTALAAFVPAAEIAIHLPVGGRVAAMTVLRPCMDPVSRSSPCLGAVDGSNNKDTHYCYKRHNGEGLFHHLVPPL